jgi:hypothetical protein
MTVSVAPAQFEFVDFDANVIAGVVQQLAQSIGITDPISLEIDETTPLSKVQLHHDGGLRLTVESGALEDPRKPRQFSETAAALAIGRALLRYRDRIEGGFGEAPADDQLELRQIAAWDTWCVARLARLGVPVLEDRWQYNFRNRHGFTDRADHAFHEIWASNGLTWATLESISTTAGASA